MKFHSFSFLKSHRFFKFLESPHVRQCSAERYQQRYIARNDSPVRAWQGWCAMADSPKLIIQAFPINSLEEVWARVLTKQDTELAFALPPMAGDLSNWRFNLDGFVTHTQREDLRRQCYTQLFRDGGMEGVSGGVLVKDERRGGFYASGLEESAINAFRTYQKFWESFGVTPPFFVGLTLSGIKNWKVLRWPYDYHDREAVIDRDVIFSPEVIVSDLAVHADIALHPIFDFVWNGGGWPCSPNYRDGRWTRPS
jgi:hypothetical protein